MFMVNEKFGDLKLTEEEEFSEELENEFSSGLEEGEGEE